MQCKIRAINILFFAAMILMMCALISCSRTESGNDTVQNGSEQQSSSQTEMPTESPENPKTIVFDDGIDEEETSADAGSQIEVHHYLLEADFDSPISSEDEIWFANSAADFSGGSLTSYNSTHFYLSNKIKIRADIACITLKLRADRPGAANHDSGYIGLRLPQYEDEYSAVKANGIWLAFQNNKVGIINGWPNVVLFETEFSFSESRVVCIEDNMEDNVISVFVENDDGVKLLVFRVIIDGQNITVVDDEGSTKITAAFSYEVDNEGYIGFWAHQNNGGVVYDDISAEWDEAVKVPYSESDPTKIRDLYSDTWTATDGADRQINSGESDVDDKLVGIFYQIWHTATHGTYSDQILYDHYAIYREGGLDAVKDAMASGPLTWPHYWAQPYFGYYLSTDRWVIRKHASMLSDIGVDFIFLDVTNGESFTSVYKTIFKEYRAMREEGLETPDICFFLSDNSEANADVFEDIWENIYSTGEYSDLYCMYKGKILILGNLDAVDDEKLEMFTVRRCWALQENLGDGKDYWNWMCETPQVPAYNSVTGEIEEISISAGLLVNLSVGRSYTVKDGQPDLDILQDGSKDEFQFNLSSTPYGLFFAEQMAKAAEVDPYVLLVTGWNEWTASRWETDATGSFIANTYMTNSGDDWTKNYYVDAFNPEFSRDIEPMSGGFGDNYYYQLAAFLRQFKGSRTPIAADGQKTIDIDGDVAQWDSVWPEYRDTESDTYHRSSIGFLSANFYTNDSGRNDIISAKVSRDENYIYFMVECADTITEPSGSNWMNLFIDSDCSSDTGWEGYDFIIGRDTSGISSGRGTLSVESFCNNSWEFSKVGTAEAVIKDNIMVVKVSASLCKILSDFDFKWADNSVDDGDVMKFLDMGDAAPNARFNYSYRTESDKTVFNDTLSGYIENGAGFQVGKSYMAASGQVHPLDINSTKVTAEIYRNRVFVPVSSLGVVSGISVEESDDKSSATLVYKNVSLTFVCGSETAALGIDTLVIPVAPYISNGQLYVPLNAVAFAFDMSYASDECGRAIISPLPMQDMDDEALGKLLNALGKSI